MCLYVYSIYIKLSILSEYVLCVLPKCTKEVSFPLLTWTSLHCYVSLSLHCHNGLVLYLRWGYQAWFSTPAEGSLCCKPDGLIRISTGNCATFQDVYAFLILYVQQYVRIYGKSFLIGILHSIGMLCFR